MRITHNPPPFKPGYHRFGGRAFNVANWGNFFDRWLFPPYKILYYKQQFSGANVPVS